MNRRILALGAVALAGLGAGGAIAADIVGSPSVSAIAVTAPAQTDSTATPPAGAGQDDMPMPSDADRSARLAEVIAPLVTDGTITQAQADKVIAALEAARPQGGPGGDHGGRGGDHGGRGGRGPGLEAAATALGMTTDELRTELSDGTTTLADVATAKGVDVSKVVEALVADATEHINQGVTDGRLTQAEADERIAGLETRITEAVNNGPQHDGPGRGHGPRGGQSPADAPVAGAEAPPGS